MTLTIHESLTGLQEWAKKTLHKKHLEQGQWITIAFESNSPKMIFSLENRPLKSSPEATAVITIRICGEEPDCLMSGNFALIGKKVGAIKSSSNIHPKHHQTSSTGVFWSVPLTFWGAKNKKFTGPKTHVALMELGAQLVGFIMNMCLFNNNTEGEMTTRRIMKKT